MTKTLRFSAIALRYFLKFISSGVCDADNRQAHIKLEAFGYAIADATKALELDPSYVKVCMHQNFGVKLGDDFLANTPK